MPPKAPPLRPIFRSRLQGEVLALTLAARYEGEPGPSPRDIDVLVLGKPDRDDVFDAARRAERRLGREVNVTQRTSRQWETATDGFAEQVRASPIVEVSYRPTDVQVEQGK